MMVWIKAVRNASFKWIGDTEEKEKMNKEDLIPFKHVLISRDGTVYWYIDENIIKSQNHKSVKFDKHNMLCLSAGCDRIFDDYWQKDLLAKREGWSSLYEEPRKNDIIYVYEITDHYDFFEIVRKVPFVEFKEFKDYLGRPCVKLIYERIDGVMETD